MHGIVWTTAVFGYLIMGLINGKLWSVSWIIFLVAAFISSILGIVENKSDSSDKSIGDDEEQNIQ